MVLGVGRGAAVRPRAPARGVAARRRGPHDRGGADRAAARRRQRPRAVRPQRLERGAAPLPRAQRRQLPRPHRARALHPAHRPAVAAAVLPPGRPDRQLRGHAQPAAALLPRRLPGDRARRRPGAAAQRAPGAVARAGHDRRPRSAPPCGRSCARCARCRPSPSWHATVWYPRPTAPPATLGRAAARAGHVHRACRRRRGRGCWQSADIAVFASDGDRADPGDARARARARERCPSPRGCPSTRRSLGEGERGFMFEPGETRRRWPPISRGWSPTRQLRARAGGERERLRRALGWGRVAGRAGVDLPRARRARRRHDGRAASGAVRAAAAPRGR